MNGVHLLIGTAASNAVPLHRSSIVLSLVQVESIFTPRRKVNVVMDKRCW